MEARRLPRVDPRRPWVRGGGGLRRIVLGAELGQRGGSVDEPARTPAVLPLRSAGPFQSCVLVVAHTERGQLDETARQVLAAAAITSDAATEVLLLAIGEPPEDIGAWGADRCLVLPPACCGRGPLDAVQVVVALARVLQPRRTLWPDRGPDAELGRRYAAALGLAAACGVREWCGNQLRLRAPAGYDLLVPLAPVLLLERGVADTELPWRGHGRTEAVPTEVLTFCSDDGLEDLGLTPGDPGALPLEEADFIVAAGAGVRDHDLLARLAKALGAAVGASRVAVDAGHFPRARQIGATGRTVSASGYLAIGISGAVQHLQGIRDCRHVIAVNTDAAAPITRRASLNVIDDSSALMAALLEALQAAQQRPQEAA